MFHLERGELRNGDEIVHLTDREREMLRILAVAPGDTVPRLSLAGGGGTANERAVDVQVSRLRRKIERDRDQSPVHPVGARHRLPAGRVALMRSRAHAARSA